MADETVLNLFVSSPGDVQRERERVELVVERLNAEFGGRVRIRAIRWETRYYSSHETFQAQIPEAAACDLVVAIFGARLGSPLPPRFPPMPTGEPYPSGTAYEVLTAIEARRKREGVPDVYVFRRPHAPLVALDATDRAEIEAQWRRLTEFFERWFRSRSGEFLAAFQEFATTDEFAAKIEDCLRQWLARRGFVAKGATWDRARLGSPYPGLAAFDETRQGVFFGRSLAVDQAIRRLREIEASEAEASRAPFLLLIGASGSGKSSLLRAGLAPRLVLPGVFPEVDLWRRAIVVPGADPFASLADALLDEEALGPELARGPFRAPALLAKQLAGDPEAALAILGDALRQAAAARQAAANFESPRPARLFLAIDQTERLLIECEPRLAEHFSALIAALTRARVAAVAMALRSDAYPRFQAIAPLVALRDAGATLDLPPPTASELEEMTTRPAALCDPPLAFERFGGVSLAHALVADARGGDALPLLQMTLSRLAAAESARNDGVLRFSDYRGMAAAVSETADEALAHLDQAARAELPNLIAGLVRDVVADPLTGAPTPAIGALDRAAFEKGRPERAALIEAFVAKRLLTAEGDAASGRVRPTHEALLRIWPEATAIIAEAAQLIRVRRALEPLAREWAEAASEDKARHLDVSPALLEGAERCVERFADAIAPATRDFVAAASAAAAARRDRELAEERRRLADAQKIAAANQRIARRTGAGLVAALALAALAGWQWQVAQQQRDRAENTLRLATQTANDLVFDLAQRFRSAAGMPVAVVKDVLDRARSLQQQLVGSGESTPDLMASVAAAQLESAVTLRDFGDSAGALALARQSYQTLAPIAAAQPSNVVGQRNLAVTDNFIGSVLEGQGDLDGALAQYQAALAINDALVKAGPNDPALLRERSIALDNVAKVQKARNDLPAALQAYRDGLALSEKLAAADPADATLRRDIGVAHANIGYVEQTQGQIESALDEFRQAQAVYVALSAASPNDGGLKQDVAQAALDVAEALDQLGQYGAAFSALQDAANLRRALAQAAPDNAGVQEQYAEAELALGLVEVKRGDSAGAEAALRDVSAIAQTLSAKDPTNATLKRLVSRADEGVGKSLLAEGDLPGALSALQSGQAIATALAAQAPKDSVPAQDVALGAEEIADVEARLGDDAAAEAAYRDALAAVEKLIAGDPTNAVYQDYAIATNLGLGDVARAKGDADGAFADFSQALSAARALAARDAAAAEWRRNIMLADDRLGGLSLSRNDADGALAYLREAQTLASGLAAADVGDASARLSLAEIDERVAQALAAKSDVSGALAAIGDAEKACQALLAAAPGDARFVAALGAALIAQGDVNAKASRGDAALEAYRQAIALFAKRAADAPKDLSALDGLAVAEDHLRAALRGAGDAKGALAAAQAAEQARKAIVALTPDSPAALRNDADALNEVGFALEGAGDLAGAIAAYRDALAVAKAEGGLAKPPPNWPVDVATADQWLGFALDSAKDADGALAAYRDGAQALAAMPAGDPPDASWRLLLARLDWRVGVALTARRDLAGALDADRGAEALLEAAMAKNAPSADESLAAVEESIAIILAAKGDAQGRAAASAQALALRKAIAQRAPSDANQRSLAADELAVCVAKAAADRAPCQAAADDARQAASRAADDANAQFSLHAALNALAAAQAVGGDVASAEATLRESLALAAAWAAKVPGDARWRFGVALADEQLGSLQFAAKAYDDALASFVAARDAAAALVALDKTNAVWSAALARNVGEIGAVANALLLAKNYDAALAALDQAKPVAANQNWLDLVRAACLMLKGETDAARALYLKGRGETILGESWERATLDGFAKLRANGQSAPLMDEIATRFAAPP
jgi:tetratricopeptide (TPR) repeat protein